MATEEEWRRLVEDELRFYGYTDEQVALASKANPHMEGACEFDWNHSAWVCTDENGTSFHPEWDEANHVAGVIGRALGARRIREERRQASIADLEHATRLDGTTMPAPRVVPDLHCWCGGEVGARSPGDHLGLGCLENITHNWHGCTCPPAQIVGSGGDLIDQDSDPECPVHSKLFDPCSSAIGWGECVLADGHETHQFPEVGSTPTVSHVDRWGRHWGVSAS